MKRQKLLLTGLGAVLTEEAKKKLEEVEEDSLSAEQRESLGLPALKEQEVALEDEDYEDVYSEVLVYVDQIQLMSGDVDATIIFLKDGITVTVTESVDEIYSYIDYLERGWFKRQKDSLNRFWWRLKMRIKGEKKVDLEEILSQPENQPDYKQE
jgi:hypothetical protein